VALPIRAVKFEAIARSADWGDLVREPQSAARPDHAQTTNAIR